MPEPVGYLLVVTAGSTASFKVTSPQGDPYRSQGWRRPIRDSTPPTWHFQVVCHQAGCAKSSGDAQE